MKKAINNTRNLNLDFVRGVACLLVLGRYKYLLDTWVFLFSLC